jgi:L-ascorbate metabolism protein UlaG (beta-lactamase superfamily)
MQIKYLAHSSYLITSESNFKIITDPYTPGGALKYSPINESADVITISHSHGDHNNPKAIQGSPVILKESGQMTVMGVNFKSIPVFHDEAGGSKRGGVLVFCFQIDGINLCHLGDIGHSFSAQQLSEIGAVDILFIPVGGYYTIDGKEADPIAKSLNPKLIFPMHYKTPRTSYPIGGVDIFLSGKSNVKNLNSFQIEIFKNSLPEETEIIVLQSAY